MVGQTPLLSRLLELLRAVEQHKGEENQEARIVALRHAEEQVSKIEEEIEAVPSSEEGRSQSIALIKLVRSALAQDREGDDRFHEGWDDEKLISTHGLHTYASSQYWQSAYSKGQYGESYDWYGTWSQPSSAGDSLAGVVTRSIAKEDRILMLGCGNSEMSSKMYEDGFRRIANIDIAEPVIEQMRARYGHLEGMTWQSMDATSLEFPDGAFDSAIDKGMFDALMSGTGSQLYAVLGEVWRVLRPGGRLLSVTHAANNRVFAPLLSPPEAPAEMPVTSVGIADRWPFRCRRAEGVRHGDSAGSSTREVAPGEEEEAAAAGAGFYVYVCDRPPEEAPSH